MVNFMCHFDWAWGRELVGGGVGWGRPRCLNMIPGVSLMVFLEEINV